MNGAPLYGGVNCRNYASLKIPARLHKKNFVQHLHNLQIDDCFSYF